MSADYLDTSEAETWDILAGCCIVCAKPIVRTPCNQDEELCECGPDDAGQIEV